MVGKEITWLRFGQIRTYIFLKQVDYVITHDNSDSLQLIVTL